MRTLICIVGVAAFLLLLHCLAIFRSGNLPPALVFTGVVISVVSALCAGFAAAVLLLEK